VRMSTNGTFARVLGATCSMVTGYLMEQEVPLPQSVATALFYGIETE